MRTFFLFLLCAGLAAGDGSASDDKAGWKKHHHHKKIIYKKIDCKVSEWKYSPCSKTCGYGTRVGTRYVIVHPKHGGKSCPHLRTTKKCFTKKCPVNCKQSEFECGKCDKYTGYRTCTRETLVYPNEHGRPCGPSSIKKRCDVDCEVSPYIYDRCNKLCGYGVQWGKRKVIVHPKNDGKKCPVLKISRKCIIKPCYYGKKSGHHSDDTPIDAAEDIFWDSDKNKHHKRVDCKVSEFRFSPCSKTCGRGIKVGRRHVIVHPKHGGEACPHLRITRKCFIKPCRYYGKRSDHHSDDTPVDAAEDFFWFSDKKSSASDDKAGWKKHHHKKIIHKTVNCKQSEFECGECNKHTGYRTCTRKTLIYPNEHGRPCGPSSIKKRCDVDCEVSAWIYGECNKSCGYGLRWGTRKVVYYPKNDGKRCPSLKISKKCIIKPCPVDCKQSEFECGECNKHTGYKTCTRKTLVYPNDHGKQCGPSSITRKCRVDCKVSDYEEFGRCSKKCGGGYKKRCRRVIYHPKNNGYKCPELCERRPCNTHHCKVDCKVSEYGNWGRCSKKCGYDGVQKRCRTILRHPKHGGKYCPSELCETRKCGKPCKRDCKQTPWICTKCDHYRQKHCSRRIIVDALYGGKPCGPNKKIEECYKYADYQYTIAGFGIFTLFASGAIIKYLRRDDSGSYEELAQDDV